jgi:hypothetical protein
MSRAAYPPWQLVAAPSAEGTGTWACDILANETLEVTDEALAIYRPRAARPFAGAAQDADRFICVGRHSGSGDITNATMAQLLVVIRRKGLALGWAI